MTYKATLRHVIDPPWTSMEPLRIGRVPTGLGTPGMYVTIENENGPLMRIDAYASYSGCVTELIVWQSLVLLGLHRVVYMVFPQIREAREVDCDVEFCKFFPSDDYLLIASGSELIRLDAEGKEVWRCRGLAIDGVVIQRIENGIIYGNGEWDPPCGWHGFKVDLETGRALSVQMALCWA